jgi:hypothetical protein
VGRYVVIYGGGDWLGGGVVIVIYKNSLSACLRIATSCC